MKQLVVILISLVLAGFAAAEDVALENPQQEARAQSLMRELRCVACENEPISQSAAPMIEDGASDEEVRGWFEDRYGEFVLFRPKADGVTGWLLWGGPFLLLLVGALIGIRIARARKAPAEPVAPEEV